MAEKLKPATARTVDRPLTDQRSSSISPRHKTASRKSQVECANCGHVVERRARQQIFCSTRCRMRAAREKAAGAFKKPGRYPPCGGRYEPHKSASENNELRRVKTASNPRILGPRRVIDVELVAGRGWKEVSSSSGVVSYVSL